MTTGGTDGHAAMLHAIHEAEATHQKIHTLQLRLDSHLNNLFARNRGDASVAVQRSYRDFDTESERVKAGLEDIHKSLVEALKRGGQDAAQQLAAAQEQASGDQ